MQAVLGRASPLNLVAAEVQVLRVAMEILAVLAVQAGMVFSLMERITQVAVVVDGKMVLFHQSLAAWAVVAAALTKMDWRPPEQRILAVAVAAAAELPQLQ
jgi:hypothetical protein